MSRNEEPTLKPLSSPLLKYSEENSAVSSCGTSASPSPSTFLSSISETPSTPRDVPPAQPESLSALPENPCTPPEIPSSTPPTEPPTSTPEKERYTGRIHALDLARCIAIFGMIYAHMAPPSYPEGFIGVVANLPNGRSSILFALLAGISLAIITGRNVAYTGQKLNSARLRILGRALALVVFASLASMMGTPVAIILNYYAVWFVLSLPFLGWSRTRLWVASAVCALCGPFLATYLPYLTSSLGMNTIGGNAFVFDTIISGIYPGVVFMAYIFAGLAIGRSDLLSPRFQLKILALGCALMAAGYAGSWGLGKALGPSEAVPPSTPSLSPSSIAQRASASSADISSTTPDDSNPFKSLSLEELRALNGEQIHNMMKKAYGVGLIPSEDSSDDFPDSSKELKKIGGSVSSNLLLDSQRLFHWKPSDSFPDVKNLIQAEPHSNTPFEAVGSGGFALVVLALCLLAGRAAKTILLPCAVVGSMSLTAYLAHIVVLGAVGSSTSDGWALLLWTIAGITLACNIWRFISKRGPCEWVTWKASLLVGRLGENSSPQKP